MGFFGSADEISKAEKGIARNVDLLHRQGCNLCPLNHAHLYSPKMPPTGSETPLIYIIGEAPGKTEDEEGEQFVGASGNLLRPLIPRAFRDSIRWNNTINCRPPNNRDPERIELECCRPRIIDDIEHTKPKAIFGFGNTPLQWAIGRSGIANWRGRRIPIKIGSYLCWYYPFFHPSALLRIRRGRDRDLISEDERATQFDLARAFAEVENLEPPEIHSKAQAREGIVCLDGSSPDHFPTLCAFLERACKAPYAGVDYETSTTRPYVSNGKLLSASVSLPSGRRETRDCDTIAFGIDHPDAKWSKEDKHGLHNLWLRFLLSDCRKISHGLHFELEWSAYTFGPETIRTETWEDSMTQAAVLDERVGKKVCFGLGFLTTQYFGIDIKELSHINRADMLNEPLSDILPYNGIDAKYHRLLWEHHEKRLAEENLRDVYRSMLVRVNTAVLTQLKGFPVDLKVNAAFAKQYQDEMDETLALLDYVPAVQEYKKNFRKPFDPGKNENVKNMVQQILRIDTELTFGEDNDNTTKGNLIKIDHPVIPLIIKYREARKLHGTYCVQVSKNTYPDGMVHQELQHGIFVVTSRASSEGPNMKNLPKRNDAGKKVRQQFIAPKDHVILAVDYKAIQVHNVAMESRDPTLCKYLWEGHDMHGEWSQRIVKAAPQVMRNIKHLDEAGKKKWIRQESKSGWTFCLFFGGQLYTAIKYLEAVCKCTIKEEELQPLFDEFWEIFAGVHAWHEECRTTYRERGYIENLTGVRRRAPVSANQLINAPIQADEAAMVWDAFNRLSSLADPDLQPVNEIYDDLTFIIPESRVDECIETIAYEATKPTFNWIQVPIGIELSLGTNLYDLTPIGECSSVELHGLPHRPNYSY